MQMSEVHLQSSYSISLLHLQTIIQLRQKSYNEPNMADKVKEVASEEAVRIRALAQDAARSGAYLYPLKVCYYRWMHSELVLTIMCTGHCVFRLSPTPLATFPLQARARSYPRPKHHSLHVRLHIPSASRTTRLHQRSGRCRLCSTPGSLRKLHDLHNGQQDVPDRRRSGGYFRRHARIAQ